MALVTIKNELLVIQDIDEVDQTARSKRFNIYRMATLSNCGNILKTHVPS